MGNKLVVVVQDNSWCLGIESHDNCRDHHKYEIGQDVFEGKKKMMMMERKSEWVIFVWLVAWRLLCELIS